MATTHKSSEEALDTIYLYALELLQKNEIDFSDVVIELEIAAEGKTLRRSWNDALRMKYFEVGEKSDG